MWERSPGAVGLCWNGFDRERYLFAESARRAGRDCLFAELAPLPGFLTLDPRGVNFAGSVPQSPDFYHAWASRNPGRHDWKAVVGRLVARAPRKSPVASEARAVDGPFVFAPLQVPGDSQIRYFGDWLDSVEAMLRALLAASESLPQGWTLVIKEHPSSKVRLGHLIDPVLFPRCVLDNASDTFDLVRRSSAVVTINSSVGLQSFCLDKPVVVLGQAFFGFEPLVRRCRGLDELRRVLGSPESIGFDAELRDKFMSYLVGAYYFPWAKEAELDPEQLRRLSRLTRGERDA
jgi:capsular polysaccharide export protein